jgi:hypothetical protein
MTMPVMLLTSRVMMIEKMEVMAVREWYGDYDCYEQWRLLGCYVVWLL